jgi:hypothetical protein
MLIHFTSCIFAEDRAINNIGTQQISSSNFNRLYASFSENIYATVPQI